MFLGRNFWKIFEFGSSKPLEIAFVVRYIKIYIVQMELDYPLWSPHLFFFYFKIKPKVANDFVLKSVIWISAGIHRPLLLISRLETIAAIFPGNDPAKTKILLSATEFEKVISSNFERLSLKILKEAAK